MNRQYLPCSALLLVLAQTAAVSGSGKKQHRSVAVLSAAGSG